MPQAIHYIQVNGATLGYEVHSAGSGKPAAIFVHGYSGRSTGGESYPELIDTLATEFTVYALDVRGHGASASEVESFAIGAIADDIVAFARQLGLEKPLHIGHSFGGYVGLYAQVRHPGTFGSIALLTPADAGLGDHKYNAEFVAVIIEHGRNPDIISQVVAPMYTRDPGLAPRQAAAMALMDPKVHELYFNEYRTLSFIEDLPDVTTPVLFVNGAQDVVVPLSAQHETAIALPNCKEVNYTAEGHMFPVESGAVVANEIIYFYKSFAQAA